MNFRTSPYHITRTETIVAVDAENLSTQKKVAKKLTILKVQVNIRKKILKQNVHIPLSHASKKRSVSEVLRDLECFIDNNPLEHDDYFQDPATLVGKTQLL